MRRTQLLIIASLSFALPALADLTVTFEAPDFAAAPGGTPTTGQGGWYLPAVAGSVDHCEGEKQWKGG